MRRQVRRPFGKERINMSEETATLDVSTEIKSLGAAIPGIIGKVEQKAGPGIGGQHFAGKNDLITD